MSTKKYFLFFGTIFFLFACSPSPEELAQKGGFASIDEMKMLNGAGFQTKAEADKAKNYSAFQFTADTTGNVDNPCFQSVKYNANCLGKKIWWSGEIIGYSQSDGVQIQLLDGEKKEVNGIKLRTIESKSLAARGVGKDKIGSVIEFIGTIDKQNFVNPDIENITYYKIKAEDPTAVQARLKIKELESECAYNVSNQVSNFISNPDVRLSAPLSLIAFYLAAEARNGFDAKVDGTGYYDKSIGVGTGTFKNNKLPACLVEVTLSLTNRSEGQRKTACFNVGYLRDREFNMYRGISVFYCSDKQAQLPIWIRENGIENFQPI
jgi:hypothetical protein